MLKRKLLVIFLACSCWLTATIDAYAAIPLKLITWVDDLYRTPEIIPKLTREVAQNYHMQVKIDDLVSRGEITRVQASELRKRKELIFSVENYEDYVAVTVLSDNSGLIVVKLPKLQLVEQQYKQVNARCPDDYRLMDHHDGTQYPDKPC